MSTTAVSHPETAFAAPPHVLTLLSTMLPEPHGGEGWIQMSHLWLSTYSMVTGYQYFDQVFVFIASNCKNRLLWPVLRAIVAMVIIINI